MRQQPISDQQDNSPEEMGDDELVAFFVLSSTYTQLLNVARKKQKPLSFVIAEALSAYIHKEM